MDMIRDTRRDKAYFDKWIDFNQNTIDEWKGKIELLSRPEGKARRSSQLFRDSLQNCIMSYCRGDSLSSMKDCVWQALEMREKMMRTLVGIAEEKPNISEMYSKLDLYNYSDSLGLLCFVLAVGGTKEDIQRTLKSFDYAGQDALLDKIAILSVDSAPSENMATRLVFPNMYKTLLDVIDAQAEQRPELMKKFIEGWYKSMKPAAWYNNDQGGEGAYYGYWCFEAALVVRLLGIDDSSFRENVYYPGDMALV
jgi:hypothetical protein